MENNEAADYSAEVGEELEAVLEGGYGLGVALLL